MAGSVNKVILVGNLGRDPDIGVTKAGKKVGNLRLATTDTWKDKVTGERRERVEWHTVVIFNDGLAGVVEKYLKKGSRVYIEGSLQTRRWEGPDGQDRYTTEIVIQQYGGAVVLLDRRPDDMSASQREAADSLPVDDDIPF